MRLLLALVVIAASTTLVGGQTASSGEFDQEYARLKKGRDYTSRKTGRIDLPSPDRGLLLDNVLEVPADYDPARTWPLRVALHGGVGRTPPDPDEKPARPLSNRIPSAGELVLHPRAWSGSEWWAWQQVANITTLVNRVRRDYNVDESRTYVTGISDGGTGVYFLAMRAATLWAACLPQNGHPLVLANPASGADGQLFAGNLVNCPMRIVNGGRDQLYPAASVTPFVEMFRKGGIPVDFQVYPEAGHDVSWWPQERPRFEQFLSAHRRVAHPERISWETEPPDRYPGSGGRGTDRLAPPPPLVPPKPPGEGGSDTALPDVNRVDTGGRERALFDRSKPSGRVDVVRKGNQFEAQTRGVTSFTLLLSPDVVNFAQPVRVTVNGRIVHDALVSKNTATLRKWADIDHDRTMLYGAELRVAVP